MLSAKVLEGQGVFFIMFKNKHLVLANGYNVNIINISLGCDSKREIQKKTTSSDHSGLPI